MITFGPTATPAAALVAAVVRGVGEDVVAAPWGGEGAATCTTIIAPSTSASSGTTSSTGSEAIFGSCSDPSNTSTGTLQGSKACHRQSALEPPQQPLQRQWYLQQEPQGPPRWPCQMPWVPMMYWRTRSYVERKTTQNGTFLRDEKNRIQEK
jgi:hypothetical protein